MKPATLLQQLPKSIRIVGHDYPVRLTTEDLFIDGSKKLAWFNPIDGELAFDVKSLGKGLPSFVVETVIHEILHGGFCHHSIRLPEHEERIVEHLAEYLTSVFKNNPTLLDWIKKGVK